MAKKTSKKESKITFKTSNTNLFKVGRIMEATGGKIKGETIKQVANPTLLSRLKGEKYIEKVKGTKDLYKPTKAFQKEFNKMLKEKVVFSDSNCKEAHSSVNGTLAAAIPFKALEDGRFKNGNQLIKEHQIKKTTTAYKNEVTKLKMKYNNQKTSIEKQYKKDISNPGLSKKEKTDLKVKYFNDTKNIKQRIEVTNRKTNNISPPDLSVKLTKTEAQEYVKNLYLERDKIENEEIREQWTQTIQTMEHNVEISSGGYIEMLIEITTDSYNNPEIIAKENYAQVMGQGDVYFFRAE